MGFTISEKLTLNYEDLTQTGNVNAGTTEEILIQPPKGKIWRILDIYIKAAAIGGSAGNHYVYIYRDRAQDTHLMSGTQVGTSNIVFNYGMWATIGTGAPGTVRDCQLMLQNIFASNGNPITIQYDNSTDTVQAADRDIVITYLEYPEVI